MKEKKIVAGSTLEEIGRAIKEIRREIDAGVEVEIIEERKNPPELKGRARPFARGTQALSELLESILKKLEIEAETFFIRRGETLFVIISKEGGDEKDLGLLIGKEGRTLSAIQLLLNIASLRADADFKKVVLDVQGYRERRKRSLEELARKAAEEAKKTGKPTPLPPMNPFERRIVHLALQREKDVRTASEGEGTERRVIVFPEEK